MDYGASVLTARATGIAARSQQSPFLHSRHWYRARIVRLLVEHDRRAIADLARDAGLSIDQCEVIVVLLECDGLVRRDGATVRLA